MKNKKGVTRRQTLKVIGTTVLGLPLVMSTNERVYGIPASIKPRKDRYQKDNLIRLSLSRSYIPTELWDDILALAHLAQDIIDNPQEMAEFSVDPMGFLKKRGLQSDTLSTDAIEMRILQAITDPAVHSARQTSDFQQFLKLLESKGVFETVNYSKIAQDFIKQLEPYLQLYKGDREKNQTSMIPVFTAFNVNAAVNVNVGVNVNVAVAVNVAAVVLVAVSVSVCGAGAASVPSFHTSEGQTMMMNAVRASQIARLVGDHNFESEVFNRFLESHTYLLVNALLELSVVRRENIDATWLRQYVSAAIKRQFGMGT